MTDKLKVPNAMQPIFDAVSKLIDDFCQTHLNQESTHKFPVSWRQRSAENVHRP